MYIIPGNSQELPAIQRIPVASEVFHRKGQYPIFGKEAESKGLILFLDNTNQSCLLYQSRKRFY
jgi:hypothetical protein